MESIQYDRIDIDENQEEVIYEMLEFLNDWLISHILKEDKLIK